MRRDSSSSSPHDDSLSSDAEDEKSSMPSAADADAEIYRLFGREKPSSTSWAGEGNSIVVTLHAVPVLYEKYQDKVDDALAEKAETEFKKPHAVVIHAKC
ncbi:hypothetical protein B296_00002240 [Ensete ventricosum]|uniref:Reticulon domain-containing protein n=1 Tax=Ensete ventricosum TaxID=4639 RepID=A0A427B8T0_ENSVE|nr:hypothetical protein B296_00002240 [Ensete ventricosum]